MPGESRTIEQIVGMNVEKFRSSNGDSQAQLGERLATWSAKAWSRQAVSQAEAGKRSFGAGDLLALTFALNIKLVDLFAIPPGIDLVTIGSETISELPAGLIQDRMSAGQSSALERLNWTTSGAMQALASIESIAKQSSENWLDRLKAASKAAEDDEGEDEVG